MFSRVRWVKEPKFAKKSEILALSRTSKSEFMIAGQLDKYGILYLYEAPLILGKKTKFPDFLIIHPITGKLIIWEHCGYIHEPEYGKAMIKKMELYQAHGFIPFETLIYTFEFNINIPFLRRLIEKFILE